MRQFIGWLYTVRHTDDEDRQRGTIILAIITGIIITCGLLLPRTLGFSAPANGRFILLSAIAVAVAAFVVTRLGSVIIGATMIIALIIIGCLAPMYIDRAISISIFYLALSLLVASVTLPAWSSWLVLIVDLTGLAGLLTILPASELADPLRAGILVGGAVFLGIVCLISYLGASVMSRTLRNLRLAQVQVEAGARDLARVNADLERRITDRTASLESALSEVQRRAAVQARLLQENERQRDTIREMSVPLIPVSDTTMVLPLVGELDGGRITMVYDMALRTIEQRRTRHLIIDITGVALVDSQIAEGVVTILRASRLLGTEVLMVGIRPEVAQTIVQLQLDMEQLRTFSTLQEALRALDGGYMGVRG